MDYISNSIYDNGVCYNMRIRKRKLKKGEHYIKAFDPTINKKVLYIVNSEGIATSVITGHQFQYKK